MKRKWNNYIRASSNVLAHTDGTDKPLSGAKNMISSKGELLLYGEIGDWWDGLDAVSIVRELEALSGDEIVVRIHSGGGLVMEGLAIYNRLKQSDKRVVVHIDGVALSMASVVAMAGDVVHVPENALLMIHKPWNIIAGNAEELRQAAEQLDLMETSLVSIYRDKTKLDEADISAMLAGEGTWMNGIEAVEFGFADVMTAPQQAVASISFSSEIQPPPERLDALFSQSAANAATTQEVQMDPAKKAAAQAKAAERERTRAILAIAKQINASQEQTDKWLDSDDSIEDIRAAALVLAADANGPAGSDGSAAAEGVEQAVASALAAHKKRSTDIREIGNLINAPQATVDGWLDSDDDLDSIRSQALAEVAGRAKDAANNPHIRIDTDTSGVRAAVANAMLHRLRPAKNKLEDEAREFRGMTILEMGRAVLASQGVDTRGYSKSDLAKALHTTDDFPLILQDVADVMLMSGYEAAPRTFTAWARQTSVTDFRTRHMVRIGEGESLELVGEDGEFPLGTVGESDETYKVETYGRIFGFSRQLLINDNLEALERFMSNAGSLASRLESKTVYGLLTGNPAMGDGEDLFSVAHGNDGTGGAISEATLAEGREAMMVQTGLDADSDPLGIFAQYLVVAPDREIEALKWVAQINPDSAGNVNPFASLGLQVIVEPRLPSGSWYMVADPSEVDTAVYAYLEGAEGVYTETKAGFEIDGVQFKVRHDFGAGLSDFRGFFRNVGS